MLTTRPARPRSGPHRRTTAVRSSRARRRPSVPASDTRTAIFAAAANGFSARGFDGVTVGNIAREAGVNKAMIYYHFPDKLALYRGVVAEMLAAASAHMAEIAAAPETPDVKVQRIVDMFIGLTAERPWGPPLMLREIAEGAPHLDLATLGLMRSVFLSFRRILAEGETLRMFRTLNPVLAYVSVVGPLLLNAARERAAALPGRRQLPMFAEVSRDELAAHMRTAIGRLFAKDER